MVPIFLIFLLVEKIPNNYLWALIIFAAASITDAIDGKIARKYNMITDFGKFLDPLADKVLVVSAIICFVQLGLTNSVVAVIIVAREFLVTSLRLLASNSSNIVIAAGIWGKLKTAFTMTGIVIILLLQVFKDMVASNIDIILIGDILMYIAAALTMISGLQYLWEYRKIIDVKK